MGKPFSFSFSFFLLGLLTRPPASYVLLCWSPADSYDSYPRSFSTMLLHFVALVAFVYPAECYFSEEMYPEESKMQPPTVVIAIIARNTAHSLPYYLGALERLDYPKDRISVWWVFLHGLCGLHAALPACLYRALLLSDYSSRSKGQWHLN